MGRGTRGCGEGEKEERECGIKGGGAQGGCSFNIRECGYVAPVKYYFFSSTLPAVSGSYGAIPLAITIPSSCMPVLGVLESGDGD